MRWIVKRFFMLFFNIYAVTTITFILVRLMPGNPIEQLIDQLTLDRGLSLEEARRLVNALYSIDLTKPLWIQYIDFFKNLLSGNLGT